MKLENKKELASRALEIGKNRIKFNPARLSEIKEAITKQDIIDLFKDKAIFIKEIKGRKTIEKRKNRRRAGSVRKKAKNKKRIYMTLTRKFRSYLRQLKIKGQISEKNYLLLRKEIRASLFKDMNHFKEHISSLEKTGKTEKEGKARKERKK